MSAKSSCIEVLVLRVTLRGGGRAFSEVKFRGSLQVIGGMLLKEIAGPWPHLHALLLPGHEMSTFSPPRAPTTMCCLTTGQKQWSQLIMDWKLQRCEPK